MDASNAPKSGVVSLQFAIFDDPTRATNPLWCERQSVALSDGYYAVSLGNGKPCEPAAQGALLAAFAGPNRYLELSVGDSPLMPRTPIAAVPFAFAAASISGAEYVQAQTANSQAAGFNIAGTGYVTGPAPFSGQGQVSANVNTNTLSGNGTRFGTEVLVGDLLTIGGDGGVGGQALRVSAIQDASNLTVDDNWTSSLLSARFQVQKPAVLLSKYSTAATKPPPALIVNAEGNVGAGTATPRARLDVMGRARVSSPDKTGIEGLELYRTDEDNRDHSWIFWHMNKQYGKNSLQIWEYRTDSNGANCAGNASDGAVCNERVTIESGGKVTIKGEIFATNLNTSSSRSFKEGIRDLGAEEAMTSLAALRPSRYKYKPDYGGEEHLGFIAEDVPEIVRSADGKAVKTGDIVALLAKVAQEQQKMVQAQRALLNQLSAENQAMRSRLENLEKRTLMETRREDGVE